MKLTPKRLYRMVDTLRLIDKALEADEVRQCFAQSGVVLSIDTIQKDLNHLVVIGLATRYRCCGRPYWFVLTDMGRRVTAGYMRQEA